MVLSFLVEQQLGRYSMSSSIGNGKVGKAVAVLPRTYATLQR